MNRGFTVIEIIITIVVLAIVSVFTFSFVMSSASIYQSMRSQNDLYFDGVYVIERISRELKDATNVSISPNSIIFQKVNYTGTVDSKPYVGFYWDGTVLRRASSNTIPPPYGGSSLTIGNNVTSFLVTSNGSQENVEITVRITLSRNTETMTLSTTICPKNYCSGGSGVLGASCTTANRSGRSFNWDYYDVVQ